MMLAAYGEGAEKHFGSMVRSCRKARGWTQEYLAERASLSADTIQRLEHGSFSPSLATLIKLSNGLGLKLSSMFSAFELFELDPASEAVALVQLLERDEQQHLVRLLGAIQRLLREFLGAANDGDDDGG